MKNAEKSPLSGMVMGLIHTLNVNLKPLFLAHVKTTYLYTPRWDFR